jgi:AcrR family transcriptional regulator
VPALWNETVAGHRRAVHDAILDAVAAVVTHEGLLAVTMSKIAEETGIGRATLYKYFPDAEAVVAAWHDRQVAAHLGQLAEVRSGTESAAEQLAAVLETYALMTYGRPHHIELAAVVHRSEHVAAAEQQLKGFLADVLREAVEAGAVRDDVPADELAVYCVSALGAAGDLASEAAVRRLVTVTLAGCAR